MKSIIDYDKFFSMNCETIKNILLRENDNFFELVDKIKLEKLLMFAENNVGYRLSSWSHLITLKLFMDIFHY